MLPVVILAGGLATRLRPITETIPKSLVAINGEPFIYHQLRLLAAQGVTQVYLLVGHLGEQIKDAVGNGQQFGITVEYIDEGETLLGTAGAVIHALSQLPPTFFLMYGDSYLTCDFKAVGDYFIATDQLGLMTVFNNDDQWDRSNVLFVDGQIRVYDKVNRTADMRHIDYGLSCFDRDAFLGYESGVPLDLTTIYHNLLERQQLVGYEVAERFYEVGSFAGLEEFNNGVTDTIAIN